MTRHSSWLFALAATALPTMILPGCVVRTVGPGPEPVYYESAPPAYQQPVVVDDQPVFVPGSPPPPQQEFVPMAPGPTTIGCVATGTGPAFGGELVPGYWEYSAPGHMYIEPTYIIVNGRWE